MEDKITFTLTRDEAIVLLEFLSRFSDTDKLTIQDQAEARVLWDMCCTLESMLHEPLSPKWLTLLQESRKAVLNKKYE